MLQCVDGGNPQLRDLDWPPEIQAREMNLKVFAGVI